MTRPLDYSGARLQQEQQLVGCDNKLVVWRKWREDGLKEIYSVEVEPKGRHQEYFVGFCLFVSA